MRIELRTVLKTDWRSFGTRSAVPRLEAYVVSRLSSTKLFSFGDGSSLKKKKGDCAGDVAMNAVIEVYSQRIFRVLWCCDSRLCSSCDFAETLDGA